MPIRPPALDDRQFADLVADLVARIPAHTPEWTNPRVGDPGRTLIDLFAWLGDALLYRVNLIPERQRLTFLRLLGDRLRPARPARGIVTLELKDTAPIAALPLKPRATFEGPLPFEARREITVLPFTMGAFYKRRSSAAEVEPGMEEALAAIHHQSAGMRMYVTTPLFSDGAPAPPGFDAFFTAADRCVWTGLFAPKGEDQVKTNKGVLDAIIAAAKEGPSLLNVAFVPALEPSPTFPFTAGAVRNAVPHVWEISVNTGPEVDETHQWVPEYLELDEILDTTASLTRSGIVRLALPRAGLWHAPTNDVRQDFNAGVGDRPPRLDDEELADRLIAWIRLRPKTSGVQPPGDSGFVTEPRTQTAQNPAAPIGNREAEHLWLTWIGINALEVEQLTSRKNVVLGESDGTADQEFALPATSIETETFELTVEEGDGMIRWRRVDDLAALDRSAVDARNARVFQLDAEAGVVRFGDGVRGRIPPAGRRVVVNQMRAGGGEAGNLPAGTLVKINAQKPDGQQVSSHILVRQPLPFSGGENAETLLQAERRIPARFRHHERAVTPDDYRSLAQETPGVPVARVEMLPRFKPQQRMEDLPGIVTVMALPRAPLGPAPNPRADRPFLEAVHAHLDKRRPLSTELYVIGCEYIPISITVAISLREDAEPNVVEQIVKATLRRVLWPLPADESGPGGGFDGQGWKFAHELSNRELAVEVARIPGVSEVAGLNLFTIDPVSGDWRAHEHVSDSREQNIRMEKWQFPELRGVVVVFGDSAPATFAGFGGGAGTNPFADERTVAVPVVPKLC